MQLLNSLNEAADIPLDQLKAILKKDKRVSKVFDRKLQLDEIDPAVFLPTINFYVLNNRHVIKYVTERGANNVSGWQLKGVRGVKVLTQAALSDITEFVYDLFKELDLENNKVLTRENWVKLVDWLMDRRPLYPPSYVMKSLKANEALRPDGPIVVYRGLRFSPTDLKNKSFQTGADSIGDGVKFLASVRKGKRTVDLSWDNASTWTTDPKVAYKHALVGREGRHQEIEDVKKLTGVLGFVISTLVDPSRVIMDASKLPDGTPFGITKDLVILDPGTYLARIVKKITPEGEKDPTATGDLDNELDIAADSMQLFAKVLPQPAGDITFMGFNRGALGPESKKDIKVLADPALAEKLAKSLDFVRNFFMEHIQFLDENMISSFTGDKEHGKTAQTIIKFQQMMNERWALKELATQDNPRGTFRRYQLTGKQQMLLFADVHSLSGAEGSALLSQKRFMSAKFANIINSLAALDGVKRDGELHRRSYKMQQPHIEQALDALFSAIGEKRTSNFQADAKLAIATIQRVENNLRSVEFLGSVRKLFDTGEE